jgi:hypothetical protein
MGWTLGVRIPAWASDFSLFNSTQTGSETHPAPYPVSTKDAFTLGGCKWRQGSINLGMTIPNFIFKLLNHILTYSFMCWSLFTSGEPQTKRVWVLLFYMMAVVFLGGYCLVEHIASIFYREDGSTMPLQMLVHTHQTRWYHVGKIRYKYTFRINWTRMAMGNWHVNVDIFAKFANVLPRSTLRGF